MHRVIVAMAMSALTACATTRLDTNRPIDLARGPFDPQYGQDGRPISDLAERLAEHPVAGPRLEGYAARRGAGVTCGVAGLGLWGWLWVDSMRTRPSEAAARDRALLIGAGGLTLAMVVVDILTRRQLREAVDAYNAGFPSRPPPPRLELPGRAPPAARPLETSRLEPPPPAGGSSGGAGHVPAAR